MEYLHISAAIWLSHLAILTGLRGGNFRSVGLSALDCCRLMLVQLVSQIRRSSVHCDQEQTCSAIGFFPPKRQYANTEKHGEKKNNHRTWMWMALMTIWPRATVSSFLHSKLTIIVHYDEDIIYFWPIGIASFLLGFFTALRSLLSRFKVSLCQPSNAHYAEFHLK